MSSRTNKRPGYEHKVHECIKKHGEHEIDHGKNYLFKCKRKGEIEYGVYCQRGCTIRNGKEICVEK